MESGEIICEKVYVSPRPYPTISFKDNWMKELDSEVAGSSKDTRRIQPKPKTQLSRPGRPVGEQQFAQEIEKYVLFGRLRTPMYDESVIVIWSSICTLSFSNEVSQMKYGHLGFFS